MRAISLALALVAACAGLGLCRLAAPSLRFSLVEFPSGTGSNVLRLARLTAGSWFSAQTYFQPASVSYWAGTSFQLQTDQGIDLTCEAGVKGWARPRARRGRLVQFVCTCEQPRQHDRRALSCFEVLRLGNRP